MIEAEYDINVHAPDKHFELRYSVTLNMDTISVHSGIRTSSPMSLKRNIESTKKELFNLYLCTGE